MQNIKSVELFRDGIGYFVHIVLEGNDTSRKSSKSYDEYEYTEDSELIVVWQPGVQPLTDVQRLIFYIITVIVVVVAVVGNCLVLYVNFSRKQRFLFRACLISLAVSDLIFVATTSILYLSKFRNRDSALWFLGPLACSLLPYFQTLTVLVNSILLVCIAMDRYMAVIRIVKGSWEPGKLFCVTCCALIWGFAAGVSSPLLTIYDYIRIYVVPLPDPDDDDPVLTYYKGYICGSDKSENGYFFAIIFSFIFAPLLITFLWLNLVVAKEVWKRRIDVSTSVAENEATSTTSSTPNGYRVTQESYISPETVARRIERKQRQVRMFKVILVLMTVFFICRMPNWIYLIYKLNNDTQENIFWVINYALGLMVLTNCMLNPFLYTFLSETIRLTTFLSDIVVGIFRFSVKLLTCRFCKELNPKQNQKS